MIQISKRLKGLTIATSLVAASMLIPLHTVTAADKETQPPTGKELSFDRKKGNCLACHMIAGGDMAGTIGPPLVAMKARFPDKEKLRAQIWDATVNNPSTSMIPFGRHQVLSEKEIDAVTDFIHSL